MAPGEARARARHAHAFLAAAELVVELGEDAGIDDIGNTVASLAVLAGIAAGDAVCGATLGERAAGADHGDAVALLKRSRPGAVLAPHLMRLVGSKTEAQYSPALMSAARADGLLTSARRMVDGMDRVLHDLA
jgi:hypothetical protein